MEGEQCKHDSSRLVTRVSEHQSRANTTQIKSGHCYFNLSARKALPFVGVPDGALARNGTRT
jgi:hypothetical protein